MAKRSSKAVALGVLPLMATAFLAGCGGEDEVAYCTDANDVVVDNSYCDDDFGSGGFFWAFVAGNQASKIKKGAKIAGASKIAASDKAALAKKGGFGSSSSSSGVGRTVSSSSSSGGG